ncbi:hypothetical protein Tco_1473942 [Tanacetum coccineum]
MSTLAEFMILSGGDNRPPMLEKHLYDYWKSRMELYMQNREHGRMILESVEHGPLIWLTIEENDATNINLQGLPSGVYSLVSHHRVANDLWEIVQLLIHDLSSLLRVVFNLDKSKLTTRETMTITIKVMRKLTYTAKKNNE